MKKVFFSGLLILGVVCVMCSSCSSSAKIVGNFNENPVSIDEKLYDEVIVSEFNYSSTRETSQYTGSSGAHGYVTNYYEVLKEFSGGDISMHIASMLQRNGIPAKAVKEGQVDKLSPGQLLLSGDVALYNYGTFQPWMVAPFMIGLGNILPAPWGFRTGAIVYYNAEVLNADGEILYQVPKKSGTASYKHWWVWGAMASSKKDFEKASDVLGPKTFDEILSVFGAEAAGLK